MNNYRSDVIEVSEDQTDILAEKLSKVLDPEHSWYIGYRNGKVVCRLFCHGGFIE